MPNDSRKQFVDRLYPFALKIEKDYGIPALAIMAQAALESGWGEKSIGNNIFGIKFKKGDYGFQEVLTTEYDDNPDAYNGQKVKSVEFVGEPKKYKFKVWQFFADYETPYDAFLSHSKLLLSDRYKNAMQYKNDAKMYLKSIAEAGYATDPNYYEKMSAMVDSVIKRL